MELYVLEGKKYRQAKDSGEWGEYMRTPSDNPLYRHVARVYYYVDDVAYCDLSTVFLGIDHNYGRNGAPILFESMIFGGGSLNETQKRYCTWDEAEAGHSLLHAKIRKKIYREFDIGGITSTVNGKRADVFYHKLVNFTPLTEIELRLIREN